MMTAIIVVSILYTRSRFGLVLPTRFETFSFSLSSSSCTLRLLALVSRLSAAAIVRRDASRAEPIVVLLLWVGSVVYHGHGNGLVIAEARVVQRRTPILVLGVDQARIPA